MLCLRGAARASCPQRPHLDVLAFHPLSVWDPNIPAASALDVAISDMAKVTGLLARAERLHTVLPSGPRPVWVTELNWKSSTPTSRGVPDYPAGPVALARSAPPVGGRRGVRRLGVPGRFLQRAAGLT
jgi:hypothetical protein